MVQGCHVGATKNESIKVQLVDPDAKKLIWNESGVFGPSRDGGLNEHKVRDTRTLVKQCTGLAPPFQAVHLRLTDKVHDEAKENATLSNDMVVGKIKAQVGLHEGFFCSDNRTRKAEIKGLRFRAQVSCAFCSIRISRSI